MTDTPPVDEKPIGSEQLLDLKALFQAIASDDEDGAELMIRGLDVDERQKFTQALKDAWETEVWLYNRAADIAARVIRTPAQENP